MKSILIALVATGIACVSGSALASEDMVNKAGCTKCHAVDGKKKAPSFKSIAGKYKGKGDAETTIVGGFRKEHDDAKAPDADVRTMVKWVLSL